MTAKISQVVKGHLATNVFIPALHMGLSATNTQTPNCQHLKIKKGPLRGQDPGILRPTRVTVPGGVRGNPQDNEVKMSSTLNYHSFILFAHQCAIL